VGQKISEVLFVSTSIPLIYQIYYSPIEIGLHCYLEQYVKEILAINREWFVN
jgi:hypothetical protein